MSFLHRNGLALRGLAVLLTAYCVLASGRALVPGLCATLADAKAASSGESCCTPKPACCHDASASTGAVITTAPHPCAFCMLVHTAAQPMVLARFHAPVVDAPHSIAAHDYYVADSTSADCFLRRAPPLA